MLLPGLFTHPIESIFQFLKGSISGQDVGARFYTYVVFNSLKVRLVDLFYTKHKCLIKSFNSLKVRLVVSSRYNTLTTKEFQFLKGSISGYV